MRKLLTLLSILLFAIAGNGFAQIFWTENFESGSTSGLLVTAYTGPNGTWTQTTGTGEGGAANMWYVSCAENDHTTGVCGTGCAPVTTTATLATLHVGSNALSLMGADPGAAYDAGGFCPSIYCVTTDKRAISPTINCTGKYTISMSFYYIEDGDLTTDDGSVWYSPDNGVTWSMLVNTPKTLPICITQGYWTHYTVALPASANNNPTVKIAFNWVNNDDGTGTDPSFAIDSVSLSTPVGSVPVPSFTLSPSSTVCEDSCVTFTNTTTGPVDSFRWSMPGITIATPHASPVSICFTTAATYTMTLTVYHSGTSYTATHTVTVNPAPHPVIHYGSGHVLSVTGSYTAYKWLNGTTVISGATNSSYTCTSPGTYYVLVDSGGCWGYSSTPVVFSTLEILSINNEPNNFWLSQNGNSSMLHAGRDLDNDINIQLFDATGRIVSNEVWVQGSYTKELNNADLAPGLYIIKLSNKNTSAVLRWLK